MFVLVGHCYDLTETPPYGPWLELFNNPGRRDSLLPAPPGLIPGEAASVGSQDALFGQVRDYFVNLSASRPLVVALDDVHWADPASLDLLRFITRQLARLPILTVAGYRTEDVGPRNRLYPLLPQLVREAQPVRIDLHRLADEAVRELIRHRFQLQPADQKRLLEQLQLRGEGNPFFIGELLRAFEEEGLLRSGPDGWALGDVSQSRLPRLLAQVIHGRLAPLGDEVRRLLAIAAVIGQDVPLALWAQVTETDEETLIDVVERAVAESVLEVEASGARMRFVHALLREALYEGLVPMRRRTWHRRIAEVLGRERKPDPDAVAYHFRQATDPREVDWLIQAGERARALYAPRLAIEHLTRALALMRESHHPRAQAVHRDRGMAYETMGEFEPARADLDTALALARTAGDRPAEWQTLVDLGFLWEGHDYLEAHAYYRRALDLARALGDAGLLARSLNRLGSWESNAEQVQEAKQHHREALEIYRQLPDRRGIATTLDLLGSATWSGGDPVAAEPLFREAAALCREHDDRPTLISCLVYQMVCGGAGATETLYHASSLVEAQQAGEEAVRIARAIDARTGETWARLMLAWCLGEQGQYRRALDQARQGLAMAQDLEHREWISAAHFTLGAIDLDLLALAEAREHLERALSTARESGSLWWTGAAIWTLARACLAQGDLPAASAVLAMAADPGVAPRTPAQRGWCYARAEVLLAQGQPAPALEALDQLLGGQDGESVGRFSPFVGKLRAEVLSALGRPGQAEAALLAARHAAARRGVRRLVWRVDIALAALYSGLGRHGEAAQAAAAARALVEELAADIPEADLREEFRRGVAKLISRGESQPAHRAGHTAGLSAREIEVLRLLASGLSNVEIAERLVLSPRTVNAHLTNIYTKLDVNTRSAAVRYALDHGIR
jgi:DNA-binding CsgD family transcriptional regulator